MHELWDHGWIYPGKQSQQDVSHRCQLPMRDGQDQLARRGEYHSSLQCTKQESKTLKPHFWTKTTQTNLLDIKMATTIIFIVFYKIANIATIYS